MTFATECVHNCNALRSAWAIFTDPGHMLAETMHDMAEFIVVGLVFKKLLWQRALDRALRRHDREVHGHDH